VVLAVERVAGGGGAEGVVDDFRDVQACAEAAAEGDKNHGL